MNCVRHFSFLAHDSNCFAALGDQVWRLGPRRLHMPRRLCYPEWVGSYPDINLCGQPGTLCAAGAGTAARHSAGAAMYRLFTFALIYICLSAGCTADGDENLVADPRTPDLAGRDARETDGAVSDVDAPSEGLTGQCPVMGFEACGGKLIGAWDVVSLCPDDAAAAAKLFEHPFDNHDACADRTQNTVDARATESGTVTFAADELTTRVTSTLDLTYGFTDACLAVAFPAASDPRTACLDQQKAGRLTCTYQPDRCVCSGQVVHSGEQETVPYSRVGASQIMIGKIRVDYCKSGSVLVLDWQKHPVSWRYWILEQP